MDRILVVESKPMLRNELTSILTQDGFIVIGVPNYLEALMKLDTFNPDMIIMDEVLPGSDCMEACFQIHTTYSIPVILLGRESGAEAWKRALQAGADFYLRVPFSHLELLARVKAMLWRYSLRRNVEGLV